MTVIDLEGQLAEQEEAIAAAERDIGRATLDGTSAAAAQKRRTAAQAEADRLRAAIAEKTRRQDASLAAQGEATAAAELGEIYAWLAEALETLAHLHSAYRDLRAAEARLDELRSHRAARLYGQRRNDAQRGRGTDLDPQLDGALPALTLFRAARESRVEQRDVDQLRESSRIAKRLAGEQARVAAGSADGAA